MAYPNQPLDPFELVADAVSGNLPPGSDINFPGFTASNLPSQGGYGTRQSQVDDGRAAVFTRNMMRWFVPEMGIIEMYVNPQSISFNDKKAITTQRTKGGFVVQYWGEELGKMNISGTTGSSGIEGINVLHDVYRAEQLAFDPYALMFASQYDNDNQLYSSTGGILGDLANLGTDLISNALSTGSTTPTRPKPTLASLAFSVELYWSGWVFRGFFEDFKLEERADQLGLFNYTINFTYTQRRGFRTNFLGWHRSPTKGPSDSDPTLGRPYSYAGSFTAPAGSVQRTQGTTPDRKLVSTKAIIGDLLLGPGIGRTLF